MAIIQSGADSTTLTIEPATGAARVAVVPRGKHFSISSQTGTIAAALGANSSVFAARLDPTATVNAYITRIRLTFTTIVTFTTAVTAGRRLALYRGSGAAASGGTALSTAFSKLSTDSSEMSSANGGDMRIATTGALTVTGITFEGQELSTFPAVHLGTSGNNQLQEYIFDASQSGPIVLAPGQLLAIRNPAAMDAAGTWQLTVDMDWYEV